MLSTHQQGEIRFLSNVLLFFAVFVFFVVKRPFSR